MSEPEENPKEKRYREIVKEELTKALEPLKNPPHSHEEPPKAEKPPMTATISHFNPEDLEKTTCPECQQKIQAFKQGLVADGIKAFMLETKNNPRECKDCGTKTKEGEEVCPTCKGNNIRYR